MIIIFCAIALLTGFLMGLGLSVLRYPLWEVKKIYSAFKKEGYICGEFKHFSEKVDHKVKYIVKPNCETYYSVTFLKRGPRGYRINIPPLCDYFSIAFLDMYGNIIRYIRNKDISDTDETIIRLSICNPVNESNSNNLRLENKSMTWVIVRYATSIKDNIQGIPGKPGRLELLEQ
ncbi:MAG: DUF1254 domain-containing protein [Marinilabiliaceae bacterium]|jgi:hypothetical protein|nr:DUF1254 domain-containing protein [Marinilabiliaceae bacterium]